jgi:phytoene dehydrogenase-like protein
MSNATRAWDAIVIGSGLGGLAAAASFARAGKRVLVLERLGNFGGAATTYRHGNLTMEASLHETDGGELFSPNGAIARLGVADAIEPIRTAEFYQVRAKFLKHPLTMPHGFADAEAAIAEAFPLARSGLSGLFGLMRRLHDKLEHMNDAGGGFGAIWQFIVSGLLFDLIGEAPRTVAQEFKRFLGEEEGAKLALAPHLAYFDDNPDKLSFLLFAMVTAQYLENGSYYLRGGSRTLTMALLQAITAAGGEARHHRTCVDILLDAEGRACGVRHRGSDGTFAEDLAPVVFGNAAPSVLAGMLPEAARGVFEARYEEKAASISLFTVSLGLDRPAADFGVEAYSTWIYPDWMTRFDQYAVSADVFGGEPGAALPLYALCDYGRLDPKLGPDGDLHLVSLTGVDRMWAWEGFDEVQDHARREAWIDAFVADLDQRFPGIAGAVQRREMATARTLRNRLGTPHGEAYGFRPTPQRLFAQPPSAKTAVPGLWLASAYTLCGGYAGAMHGGLIAAGAASADAMRRARAR